VVSKIACHGATLLVGLLAAPVIAAAQDFPSRPITLIVPYSPGGATDVQARALAAAAEKTLGQSVIVLNRPGAGGTLGPVNMSKTAKPDGYTVSILPDPVFRQPYMQKVDYHPVDDFSYIIGLSGYSYGLLVPKDSPIGTIEEFIESARKADPPLAFGSVGAGGTGHLAMGKFSKLADFKMLQIPYKGMADASQALLAGDIDAILDAGWGALAQAGQVRVLAVFGQARPAAFPDIPTAREKGYDVVVESPYGIAGPAGMDPAVVKVLHDGIKKATEDDRYRQALAAQNQSIGYLDSESYRQHGIRQFREARSLIESASLPTIDPIGK
jgi:tripartite-type tricarboxylate transporter receptor subunit TctC